MCHIMQRIACSGCESNSLSSSILGYTKRLTAPVSHIDERLPIWQKPSDAPIKDQVLRESFENLK